VSRKFIPQRPTREQKRFAMLEVMPPAANEPCAMCALLKPGEDCAWCQVRRLPIVEAQGGPGLT